MPQVKVAFPGVRGAEREEGCSTADSPCLYSGADKHLTPSEIYAEYHFTGSLAFYDATQGSIMWELWEPAIREAGMPVLHSGTESLCGILFFATNVACVLERITLIPHFELL